MFRPLAILLLVAVAALAQGCRHGAVVPRGWTLTPNVAGMHDPARDREPRVQVLIHYDRLRSTHAAVRVVADDKPAVFWDPGGAYGLTKPSYGRTNDIILDAPPDLPTWWNYRKRWLREPFLLVFEWDLDNPQASAMRRALLDGAAYGRDATLFQTRRAPGFCGYAVSDFLRDYGPPQLRKGLGRYFMPDELARRLWKKTPDRVLRYDGPVDALPTVLMPPADDHLSNEALTQNGVESDTP